MKREVEEQKMQMEQTMAQLRKRHHEAMAELSSQLEHSSNDRVKCVCIEMTKGIPEAQINADRRRSVIYCRGKSMISA